MTVNVLKKTRSWIVVVFSATLLFTILPACNNNTDKPHEPNGKDTVSARTVDIPSFSADSAYAFIQKQVDFGPRVPGSEAHKKCGDWLVAKLKSYAGTENVIEQNALVELYDKSTVEARNIIALFNPRARYRILLCAHWDTRMVSDHDVNPDNRDKPIPGANDGGSGVAVLLEAARHFANANWKDFGLDIVLFDVEDQGVPNNLGIAFKGNRNKTWCLGSQHWAANRHRPDFNYQYGILLDMVGAKDAIFPREMNSMKFAPRIVKMTWRIAHQLGYNNFFSNQNGTELIDDHYFINKIAKIPTIDIIHHRPVTGGFNANWHTQYDDMKGISKAPLMAVGHTVLYIAYHEAAGLLKL